MRRARLLSPLPLLLSLLVLQPACGDNIGSGDGDGDVDIEIPGMDAPVEAYFDEYGVLTLRCQTDADCFAAQGYFHAAHRFFQMDLRRRFARGKISEVAGRLALDIDTTQRLLHSTADGRPIEEVLLENADAETRAAISAYTRGVNAWLADLRAGENGAATALERNNSALDHDVIDDWTDEDSAASVLLLTDILTNTSQAELDLAAATAALGPDAANDIFNFRPPTGSIVESARLGGAAAAAPTPGPSPEQLARLRRYRDALARASKRVAEVNGPARELAALDARGSNNWVIGPDLGGGKTLLANDPHLGLSNPAVWYLNHLDSKTSGSGTIHVAGVSFAGAPGIILGHNENIAWGATTTDADFTDVYLETLAADKSGVVIDGSDVPFVTVDHDIGIANMDPETVQLQFVPGHGPVIDIDTDAGTALSLRWTVTDADTDLNFIHGLMTARSVDEARVALTQVTTAGQNFVVIDDAGHYAWFPYNRYPTRPWAATNPPWLPIPGDGSAEWGPPVAYEDIPQEVDASRGYIATANNDWTGALADGNPTNDGQDVFQYFVAPGFRHQRIVERIEALGSHDLASIQSIQHDVRSNFGAMVVPSILAAANGQTLTAAAQEVVAALDEWDFECPSGLDGTDPEASPASSDAAVVKSAAGCAAFHVLWPRLVSGIFGDELAAAGVEQTPTNNAAIFALTEADPFGGRDYFDDVSTDNATETKADVVAAALDAAGTYLAGELGASRADWQWGRIHTTVLRADLFSSFGIDAYDSDAFANGGGTGTVDVAAPRNAAKDDYSQQAGASMRLACAAGGGDPMTCTIALPGGQRHHRDDPFYLSLLDEWLGDQPLPFIFSVDEAEAGAVESVRLGPE